MENAEAQENIKSTIDKVSHTAHQAVDKMTDASYRAAETLGEKGEQLKNAELEMMEDYRTYVRDNPMKAVGIAVAAGFMLSRVMGGGHREYRASK
jgi:ElaB/YqjD/DUF883 family membrane-anchored ribosome-binding protein